MLWIVFWLAFAAFVVFYVARNSQNFFTVSTLQLVRKLLWACIITCVGSFAINWSIVHNGNPAPSLTIWLFQSSLWSIFPVAIARVIQEVVINQRARVR